MKGEWEHLGDGLWHGPRTWRFMWHVPGLGRGRATRCLSLGSVNDLTEADARRLANYARMLVEMGSIRSRRDSVRCSRRNSIGTNGRMTDPL
jgi:hypothetical protein